MDLEGPWQKFQLSDVTDGVSGRICEQLLVSKEGEQLIETQLRLIVHRQIVRQAGKYGFLGINTEYFPTSEGSRTQRKSGFLEV